MTGDQLRTLFQEYGETDESHKFDRVAVKFSKRDDLHAFILLDNIMPDGHTMVSAAAHNEIFWILIWKNWLLSSPKNKSWNLCVVVYLMTVTMTACICSFNKQLIFDGLFGIMGLLNSTR